MRGFDQRQLDRCQEEYDAQMPPDDQVEEEPEITEDICAECGEHSCFTDGESDCCGAKPWATKYRED